MARFAWGLDSTDVDDGAGNLAGIAAASMLMWLTALVLLGNALFHMAHGIDLTTQLARAALALVAVVTVMYWKAAVPTWCYRPVIGVARRADLAEVRAA